MKELVYSVSIRDHKEPWIEVRKKKTTLIRQEGNISKLIMILLEMGQNSNAFKMNADKYPDLIDIAIKQAKKFRELLGNV